MTEVGSGGEKPRDWLVTEIRHRSYAEIEHGINQEWFGLLVSAYNKFTTELPDPEPETLLAMLPTDSPDIASQLDNLDRSRDQQATWHKYRTNVNYPHKPLGYTNRSIQATALRAAGIEINDDPKEYFHWTPDWSALVKANHEKYGWGNLPPHQALALNLPFREIHRGAVRLARSVVSQIELVHPEVGRYFSSEFLRQSPLRLLFYHNNQPSGDDAKKDDQYSAGGHYDKGLLTLQLAESHQGLQIAPNATAEPELVVRRGDAAAVFMGQDLASKLQSAEAKQDLAPAWHSVQTSENLNKGRRFPGQTTVSCARWAIIFFANSLDQPDPKQISKISTHNRFINT